MNQDVAKETGVVRSSIAVAVDINDRSFQAAQVYVRDCLVPGLCKKPIIPQRPWVY